MATTFVTRADAISYVVGHLEAYTKMVDADPDVLREIADDAVGIDWRDDPDELVERALALLDERADELGIGLPKP